MNTINSEGARDAMVAINGQGLITLFNPAAEAMFGLAADQMLGRPIDRLMPDALVERHGAACQAFLQRGESCGVIGSTVELPAVRSDGSQFPIELSLSAGERGTEQVVLAVIRDITERKLVEDQLRDSENRYRTLFESSTDAIMLLGEKGFLDCNRAALEMLGMSDVNELRCLHPVDLSPPYQPDGVDSATSANEKIAVAFRDGMNRFEWLHCRKHGADFPAEVWLTALQLGGRPVLQATVRDITERKRAEEQIARQGAVLGAINRVFREALICETEEAVAATCLAVAEELTGSKFGFIGELNEAGLFDTIAISDPGWAACRMPRSDAVQAITNMPIHGFDRATLRDGVTRIVNAPAAHPDRVGTPAGHPIITSFLGVALKHAERTIGMIGLANKEAGYEATDQQAIEALSGAFVEALMRKRAESSVRRNQERFRRIIDTVTTYVFTVRLENGQPVETVHCPACVTLTGYTPAEFGADPHRWIRVVHEEDRQLVTEQASRLLSGDSCLPVEHRIRRKDGAIHWVRSTLVPEYDGRDDLVSYEAVITDITERKQAEEELRDSENRYRTLFESSTDAIMLLGETGFFDCNPATLRIFGLSDVNEFCSVHPAELSPPHQPNGVDSFTAANEKIAAAFRNGWNQFEWVHRRKSDEDFPAEVWLTAFQLGGSQVLQATVRDITERKRVEETERRQKGLEDAVRAMEQVLGVVGHELRTPLAALRATSEFLLTEDAKEMDEWDMFLTTIHDETIRMAEMVNNMLDVARLNSGHAKWDWTRVSLTEACDESLNVVRPLVDHALIELDYQVQPADLSMNGDPDAIRRLLINFISNSAKHTRNGFIRVNIAEASKPNGRWIEIRIHDTGKGISDAVAKKLGRAFVLNSGLVGSDYVRGAGLGLAICGSIVAAHGGSISVASQPGQGSTFTILMRADLDEPVQKPGMLEIVRETAA